MATNYTELQAEVADWLNKSNLSAQIPQFISLAESEFNRRIRSTHNEARTTLTVTGNVATLPADFLAVRTLSDTFGELGYLTAAQFANLEQNDATARFYVLTDDQIRTRTDAGTLALTYYQTIPPLATNNANWLLAKHANLYLFQSLFYAALYMRDEMGQLAYKREAEGHYALLLRDERQKTGRLEVRAT